MRRTVIIRLGALGSSSILVRSLRIYTVSVLLSTKLPLLSHSLPKICSEDRTTPGFSIKRHKSLYSPAVRSISVSFLYTFPFKRSTRIPPEISCVSASQKLLLRRSRALIRDISTASLKGFVM